VTADEQKRAAAHAALDHVRDGMRLGLGTGSTAKHFVDAVGAKVKEGWTLSCVPTSERTREQAQTLGIRLVTLDDTPQLDLAVDGADEIDGDLNLIKGGGGALLREKIVATAAQRFIVIADASKKVERLGKFPLPIEVVPFGAKATALKIDRACAWAGARGGKLVIRMRDGKPFVTDNGNLVFDCALGVIPDAPKLSAALSSIPGVVDHGLFIGMASLALIAGDGGVMTLTRKTP
jgi:ribose 5-phosphate isomerase A